MIRPRSLARRAAFQYCFMCDQNSEWQTDQLREFLAEHGETDEVRTFARALVVQVINSRERVDELLQQTADNWRLSRIAAVERNILRVGCAELLAAEVPAAVAISEAMSLAKKFGSKDSSRFVNGILDRIAGLLKKG